MPGSYTSGSVATTAVLAQDLTVSEEEWLTVIAVAGPTATAAGDISVAVLPYLSDRPGASGQNAPLAPATLPLAVTTQEPGTAAVLAAGKAYVLARYAVTGLDKVQVQAKNNNVGTLPVEINAFYG